MSVFVSPYSPTQQSGVVARFPPNIYAITSRAPTSSDYGANVGDFWIYLNTSIWQLVGKPGNVANWIEQSATGNLATLTGDSGTATPSANNIQIKGTANEVSTVGSSHQIALSIPSTFIAPGSIASTSTLTGGTGIVATTGNIVASTGNISSTLGSVTAATTVTATLGAITATNGNLVLGSAGNKLLVHASTAGSDSIGTGTLSTGGTVTIATTAVTASSKIFLSYLNCASSNPAALSYGSISAGVHFVVSSQDTADTSSTFNYWIIN